MQMQIRSDLASFISTDARQQRFCASDQRILMWLQFLLPKIFEHHHPGIFHAGSDAGQLLDDCLAVDFD